MKTLDELLFIMVEANASDLHLKVGSPPVIRVDGELAPLDVPECSPEDTKDYAASLMSDKQIRRFSETNEIDFAYSAPNSRPLPRERVPAAGHHLHRHAPGGHEDPLLRGVDAPGHRPQVGARAAGTAAGDRYHGLWQDHDPGLDDRPHQPQPASAHRHGRGPDRDPARGQAVHRQPARGRPGHRVVRVGAQVRAAAGPGRHPHRRDARPGDGADRAHRRPDRALRHEHAPHDRRDRDDQPHHRLLSRCTSRSRCASCWPARCAASSRSGC